MAASAVSAYDHRIPQRAIMLLGGVFNGNRRLRTRFFVPSFFVARLRALRCFEDLCFGGERERTRRRVLRGDGVLGAAGGMGRMVCS